MIFKEAKPPEIIKTPKDYFYFIRSRHDIPKAIKTLILTYIDLEKSKNYPNFVFKESSEKDKNNENFDFKPYVKLIARIETYFNCFLRYQKEPSVNVFIYLINSLRTIDYVDFTEEKLDEFKKNIILRYDPTIKKYNHVRLIADIVNAIGACVVSENIRRCAEVLLGDPDDDVFMNLKNFELNPERSNISWTSNNSVVLKKTEDFKYIPKIADKIKKNGEPGFINMINIQRFGRVNHRHDPLDPYTREYEPDKAIGINPCGEIPLCSFEFCNLAEGFPTKCFTSDDKFDEKKFYQALRYATFYASTVSLIPTHSPLTNRIVNSNRRIGIAMSGISDLYNEIGFTELTRICRAGYKIIREENLKLSLEAGIPPSIRVTTEKPSGKMALLVGTNSGLSFPISRYSIRRLRILNIDPVIKQLEIHGYYTEKDQCSDNTIVVEFPIDQGKTRELKEISIWEQLAICEMLQREWSDNSIAFTGIFNPKTEGNCLEQLLAIHAPVLKGCTLFPNIENNYNQLPYETITKEKYDEMVSKITPIDWSNFGNSDGDEPLFCTNDTCDK